MRMGISAVVFTMFAAFAGPASAQQNVDNLKSDFDKAKGESKDGKHEPIIEAPKTVTAGEWFPVKISMPNHPSLVEHFIRFIALEADGVEINRAYLHPVMSKGEVTFVIALGDNRTIDPKTQAITKRSDKEVTLRAVEAPNHTSQWWQEVKVLVKSPVEKPAK